MAGSFNLDNLVHDIRKVLEGGMQQFAPPIQLSAAALNASRNAPFLVELPQLCNVLWIPRYYVQGGTFLNNPSDLHLGISINRPDAPVIAWGLDGDFAVSFSGAVQRIYVQLLNPTPYTAAQLTMYAGLGIGMGHSSSLTPQGTAPAVPNIDGYRIGSGGYTPMQGGSVSGGGGNIRNTGVINGTL